MHYTGGWSAKSACRTFAQRSSKVSAHVTIDRDGTIYQHVPFNVKAWHAGPSSYRGYSGLNNHSIGIELVNPGYLRRSGDHYVDWAKNRKSAHEIGGMVECAHATVGSGMFYWPEYTPEQLNALHALLEEVVDEYGILDFCSHEEIDLRGWKTDPGPAFDMAQLRDHFLGQNEDREQYVVTASVLNVRSGPGVEFEICNKMSRGSTCEVGEIIGNWARVTSDGWVHKSYLRFVA